MAIYFRLCIFAVVVCSTPGMVPEYHMDEHCSQTLALNQGSVETVRLRLTKAPNYPDAMFCAMRVQAPEGKKLLLRFREFNVQGSQDALCQDGDYLQLFDGPTEESPPIQGQPVTVCQLPASTVMSTSDRFLILRFISNTDRISDAGIQLTITAFNDGPCGSNQFQCKTTGQCVKESLRCDGVNHCPDDSDEAMPDCLSTAAIAGIVVAGVVVFAAVVVAVVVGCVVRERRRRARIIKRGRKSNGSIAVADAIWNFDPVASPTSASTIDTSFVDSIWDDDDSDSGETRDRIVTDIGHGSTHFSFDFSEQCKQSLYDSIAYDRYERQNREGLEATNSNASLTSPNDRVSESSSPTKDVPISYGEILTKWKNNEMSVSSFKVKGTGSREMSVSSFKVKGTGSSENAMAVPRFAEGNLPRSSVKVMGPRGQEAQNVPGGIWDIKIGDMNVGSYWDCNSTLL